MTNPLTTGEWHAEEPPFSRLVSGPVKSVPPFSMVSIAGEVLMPRATKPFGGLGTFSHRHTEFEPLRLAYRQEVHGMEWREKPVREAIERLVRRQLADELLKHFTIPMRVEEVAW